VYFVGDIVNVEQFLNTLDVFVLNSHSEGMSNTILEAMACGLPVVATAVGANPMLVANGESGYLVPPGDVESLCSALTIIAGNRYLQHAMGRAGRLRIVNSFGIDRMVQAYSRLYHTLHTTRPRCAQPSFGSAPRRQPKRLDTGQNE
jgi:glycosyltransferase involved in cell wall biosynthesis